MAKYKRQKVKHYHRSFYSREMRVKRGIGIAVLVVAVLAAAWFAAPTSAGLEPPIPYSFFKKSACSFLLWLFKKNS